MNVHVLSNLILCPFKLDSYQKIEPQIYFVFFSYKFMEGISTIEDTDYKFSFEIKVTLPDRIYFDPIIYCPGIALSVRLVARFYLYDIQIIYKLV